MGLETPAPRPGRSGPEGSRLVAGARGGPRRDALREARPRRAVRPTGPAAQRRRPRVRGGDLGPIRECDLGPHRRARGPRGRGAGRREWTSVRRRRRPSCATTRRRSRAQRGKKTLWVIEVKYHTFKNTHWHGTRLRPRKSRREEAADRVIDSLGLATTPFDAIHVRRGDEAGDKLPKTKGQVPCDTSPAAVAAAAACPTASGPSSCSPTNGTPRHCRQALARCGVRRLRLVTRVVRRDHTSRRRSSSSAPPSAKRRFLFFYWQQTYYLTSSPSRPPCWRAETRSPRHPLRRLD